jgi:hypothetical protein
MAPTISSIADQTMPEDTSKTVSFTINDDKTAPGGLNLAAISSNVGLFPLTNVSFGGSGSNRTMTLTPTANMSGSSVIEISVSDGSLVGKGSFTMTVTPVNDPPTVTVSIDNQTINESVLFNFTVPANTFIDIDVGDSLVYAATLADGTVLPGWLSFNTATLTFSGTAATADLGTLNIKVTATDSANASVATNFTLTIIGKNVTITPSSTVTGTAATATMTQTPISTTTVTGTPITGTPTSTMPTVTGTPGSTETVTATPSPVATTATPKVTPIPTPLPSERGSITGRVTGDDNTGVANIMVVAYWFDGVTWSEFAKTTTDQNGEYVLDNLPPGSNRVHFSDPTGSYADTYYGSRTEFSQATKIAVTSNQITANINVILSKPKTPIVDVSGSVGVQNDPYNQKTNIVGWSGSQINFKFSLVSCFGGETPTEITLVVGQKTFPMTKGDDSKYVVTLNVPADLPDAGQYDMEIKWKCDTQPQLRSVGQATILSAEATGQVIDATTTKPISDAIVTLYRVPSTTARASCPTTATGGSLVNPDVDLVNGVLTVNPAVNPQRTGDDGRYVWSLPEGCWYVDVQAEGYTSQTSMVASGGTVITNLNVASEPDSSRIYLPVVVK